MLVRWFFNGGVPKTKGNRRKVFRKGGLTRAANRFLNRGLERENGLVKYFQNLANFGTILKKINLIGTAKGTVKAYQIAGVLIDR